MAGLLASDLVVRIAVVAGILLGSAGLAGADDAGDGDSPEQAEKRAKAQALVSAATELYFAEKYEEALPLFRQAYELYPRPKYVMNMGSILAKLERTADAANTYELFLRLPGRDRSKDSEVEAIIKRQLASKLGRFKLQVTGLDGQKQPDSGAAIRIFIDDRRVEAPVDAEIWVEPGKHRIRLDGGGFTAKPVSATAVQGKTVKVKINVVAAPDAGVEGSGGPDGPLVDPGGGDGPSDEPGRPGGGYRIGAWTAAGLTGASIALAVISQGQIASSERDLRNAVTAYQLASGDQLAIDDSCGDAETRTPNAMTAPLLAAVLDACDKGESAATRANIFYGTTAVLGVVSVFLFYKGYIASPGAEPATGTVQIQPTLTPQVVGAELTVRF